MNRYTVNLGVVIPAQAGIQKGITCIDSRFPASRGERGDDKERFRATRVGGFTLIEVLVTVSIIAIVMIVGLTVFQGTQKNARDARRKLDINAISKALEANKVLNSDKYALLANNQFTANKVPVESVTSYTPQYSILYRTDATLPAKPPVANWQSTAVTPTPDEPLGTTSVAITAATIATGIPPTTTTKWRVCARLEDNTVYCMPSVQ